jgi:hypothetical protein
MELDFLQSKSETEFFWFFKRISDKQKPSGNVEIDAE